MEQNRSPMSERMIFHPHKGSYRKRQLISTKSRYTDQWIEVSLITHTFIRQHYEKLVTDTRMVYLLLWAELWPSRVRTLLDSQLWRLIIYNRQRSVWSNPRRILVRQSHFSWERSLESWLGRDTLKPIHLMK